jgi:trimethylamine--corrinoid protein Co-methyltransferase
MTVAQPRKTARREGGRAARQSERSRPKTIRSLSPVSGGHYKPLEERDVERIYGAALDVLEQIGMGDPTPELVTLAAEKGQRVGEDGRLRFSRSFMEGVIDQVPKRVTLHGRAPEREVELGMNRVHYSSGGMAVRMVDP